MAMATSDNYQANMTQKAMNLLEGIDPPQQDVVMIQASDEQETVSQPMGPIIGNHRPPIEMDNFESEVQPRMSMPSNKTDKGFEKVLAAFLSSKEHTQSSFSNPRYPVQKGDFKIKMVMGAVAYVKKMGIWKLALETSHRVMKNKKLEYQLVQMKKNVVFLQKCVPISVKMVIEMGSIESEVQPRMSMHSNKTDKDLEKIVEALLSCTEHTQRSFSDSSYPVKKCEFKIKLAMDAVKKMGIGKLAMERSQLERKKNLEYQLVQMGKKMAILQGRRCEESR